MSDPLVSAIMPTRGRRKWAAEAIEMWRAQNWPSKELVVVDDPLDPSFDAPPRGVRYLRESAATLGDKRNLAVATALGAVIIHWDSDDLHAPDRIRHQVASLTSGAFEVAGYNTLLFEDAETGECWRYHGRPGYIVGASLCYWRRTWLERPFPSIDNGEDNWFQKNRRLQWADSEGRLVQRIHNGNVCPRERRRASIELNSAQWEPVSRNQTSTTKSECSN